MKLLGKAGIVVVLTLVVGKSTFSNQSDYYAYERGDQKWELAFGTGISHRIPPHTSVPHLDFNVAKLEFEKFTSPRASIGCELCLGNQTGNDDNAAVSTSANYTRYFLAKDRFTADWKFGLGVMNLQYKVTGQGSETNFDEHLGLGLQYAVSKNNAISLDYTFYHASNAGIERPNPGINTTVLTIGYSWHR